MTATTQSIRKAVEKTIEVVNTRVYLNTDQNNLNSNAWTKVALDSLDVDSGSSFNTLNNRFVVPASGLYQIIANVQFTNLIANKAYGVAIYVNGTSISEQFGHASATDNLTVKAIEEVFLKANDYVEVYAKPDVGGSANTVDIESGSKTTNLIARLVTKEGIRQ